MGQINNLNRPWLQLSDEIRGQCHIYLDEGLYLRAITLLTSLVTSGICCPNSVIKPIFIPPAEHIEIVSTLLVHPIYTTRAPPKERVEIAARSTCFLRDSLSRCNPLHPNLRDAFDFSSSRRRRVRRTRTGANIDDEANDSESDFEQIRGIVANEESIRNRAQDIWHIVGWAFNCSVSYPKRWKYWKVWLEYMLDVLDRDWTQREQRDSFPEQPSFDPDVHSENEQSESALTKSLLIQYLSEARDRSSAIKRIVRAAFANGEADDLRAYPEIFKDETKDAKAELKKKRKREFEYEDRSSWDSANGDEILDHRPTSSCLSDTGSESTSRDYDDETAMTARLAMLGGVESVSLRQRVLALLSRASAALPEHFTPLKDLYEIYYEGVRNLPLKAFCFFVSPSGTSRFPDSVLVTLSQLILNRLTSGAGPRVQRIAHRSDDTLSQSVLELQYLPFAANTSSIEDNAKVSILVECLFRLFLKSCDVYHTPTLEVAINEGISAREKKVKIDRRRKETHASKLNTEYNMMCLRASGTRLRSLLGWVEKNGSSIET
ncbi:hypothetical protein F5884DRAFT_852735 [Xylogone sp. PMI_703]|nr:hypothetical protein F5884DRAFT_852735 [Xylogone sp. PMI_703]